VAIGNKSAGISTTEKFGKLLRAHKLTIGIFIVLAPFGLYPIIFVGLFTHWYAYVLSFYLLDLLGIFPTDSGIINMELNYGVQIPIVIGYSLFLALWINYIFSHIGGTRHRTAIALSITLVMWTTMPFIVTGIINSTYID
jgi:hypothetical protein